jgi:hypothetical protein
MYSHNSHNSIKHIIKHSLEPCGHLASRFSFRREECSLQRWAYRDELVLDVLCKFIERFSPLEHYEWREAVAAWGHEGAILVSKHFMALRHQLLQGRLVVELQLCLECFWVGEELHVPYSH